MTYKRYSYKIMSNNNNELTPYRFRVSGYITKKEYDGMSIDVQKKFQHIEDIDKQFIDFLIKKSKNKTA